MILLDCQHMRREYGDLHLRLDDVLADPIQQFIRWYHAAIAAGHEEANAMTLATVDADMQPNVRIVLLKEIDDAGFVFYTNYESAKGHELTDNPAAALNFYWPELSRQVRIRGVAKRIPHKRAAAYFATRSRDSQLSVYAYHQSSVITEGALTEKLAEMAERFGDNPIPCPDFWGGYCVEPRSIEFFQGRNGRAHDRVLYKLHEEHWLLEKLAP